MTSILYPFIVTCAIGVSVVVSSASTSEKSVLDNGDNSSLYRLPKNVVPEFYDILLLTNVTRADFNYKGEVRISLRVLETTRQIVLHADKLKILGEKSLFRRFLLNDDYEEVPIKSQHSDNETQFYVITFLNDLEAGNYSLELKFHGEVLDDVFGFYRSSYIVDNDTRKYKKYPWTKNRSRRWLGVTQFSPTFARRAFPCMDEPAFKASFQLRVGHYGNETVTSNTFPESRNATDRPDYYITRFAKTPRMSTYLFGWAIHDFRLVNSSLSQIPLWTRFSDSELLPLQPLALLVESTKIYSALENYTHLSNPLGKLEQFAVPDFNFNGMENWGLVTFRESVPLAGESQTPLRIVHSDLVTVAHEYAHSWFGNLVTPAFWDNTWLKEGFATYFAYVAMDMAHEDWRAMNLFALDELQESLLLDSVEHNRTMNGRGVGSPKSAKAALDFVTYKKGASIIRMIADVLGDEPFRAAIRSYLQENRYKAVTPFDLYEHLEREFNSSSGISISDFVESWANQPNYPLVRTSRTSSRQILVTQQVFHLNSNKSCESDASRHWLVPIRIAAPSSQRELVQVSTWHSPDLPNVVDLPVNAIENSWYILNPEQIGFYRVDYESSNWEALRKLLLSDDRGSLPRAGRAALLDDAFNLARAGHRGYKLALDLMEYLKLEFDYEPWYAACRAIRLLDSKLKERPDVQLAFRRYAIELMKPIYEQLSFKENSSDSRIRKMHRNLIISTACSLNLVDCIADAKLLFSDWIEYENKTVPANLKDFVYRVGIVNGTDDDWIKLWQRFLKTELYSEKEIMMKALSSTTNPDFITRLMEFSIQPDSDIKVQYRLFIVQSIVNGDSKNIENVLNYLNTNFEKIIRLKGAAFLGDVLTAIGKETISNKQLNKLSHFINENAQHLESALDVGNKAINLAKDNIAWINNCTIQVANYFNDKHT